MKVRLLQETLVKVTPGPTLALICNALIATPFIERVREPAFAPVISTVDVFAFMVSPVDVDVSHTLPLPSRLQVPLPIVSTRVLELDDENAHEVTF